MLTLSYSGLVSGIVVPLTVFYDGQSHRDINPYGSLEIGFHTALSFLLDLKQRFHIWMFGSYRR